MVTPEKPIAPRRSSVAVSTMTTAVTAASARSGSERRSSIVANQLGSSRRRAIASTVRETPGMRLRRTPSAAMPAPTRTIGVSQSNREVLTTRPSGASLAGDGIDGHGGEHGDTDGGVDHQHAGQGARDRLGDGGRRVADLLAEGGDAGVAGEREEQEPGGAQDAGRRRVDRGDACERGGRARPAGDDDRGERDQRDREQALGDDDGAGQPADVDDRHGRDRCDTDEPCVIGPQVGAGGERDGDARGGLADDESPPGEVAPDRPELATGVHVGAARLGMHGGQLGRGGGVAERDDCGDDETDQDAGAGGVGGRAPRAEHAGADHRPGADGHGVEQAQSPLQRRRHRRADRSLGVTASALNDWLAGRARRSCRTGPGAGSACRRVLPRRRCGTLRRRRGAVRPRRRCRRR